MYTISGLPRCRHLAQHVDLEIGNGIDLVAPGLGGLMSRPYRDRGPSSQRRPAALAFLRREPKPPQMRRELALLLYRTPRSYGTVGALTAHRGHMICSSEARQTTTDLASDQHTPKSKPDGPSGPLVGVKVLDLSTVIAGPLCATMLADFGAEVLKVELPGAGDHIRHLPPHKDGIPLWSKVVNRNKRGITLDLRLPEGVRLFERLIEDYDVLVENFRPGTLDKWGLSAARLHELNKRLIILRVTGFGQTGPNCHKPGFARIFEALSGFANLCGEPSGPPLFSGYPISDGVTGIFGALAVLAALHHRDQNGASAGQEIDLSATEAMFRLLDFMAIEYDQLGSVRGRSGNLNAYSAPSSVYITRDGQWIALAVSAPTVFARLARAIDRDDLLTDVRFMTNVARLEHREAIEEIMRAWFLARTAAEAMAIFTAHEVSAAPIYSIADIFKDPHFEAREVIISVPDTDFGAVKMQAVVPRFSKTPGNVWRAGPSLGEHNNTVYRTELGLDSDTLEDLRSRKVI